MKSFALPEDASSLSCVDTLALVMTNILFNDQIVMSLVEGNGWFRTKSFECIMDATGKTKPFVDYT
jgi:hypothetical protein